MWPISLLFFLSLALGSPVSQPENRYAILDNDWGAVSFLPFLIALKNDVQVLGLVSGELLMFSYTVPAITLTLF